MRIFLYKFTRLPGLVFVGADERVRRLRGARSREPTNTLRKSMGQKSAKRPPLRRIAAG